MSTAPDLTGKRASCAVVGCADSPFVQQWEKIINNNNSFDNNNDNNDYSDSNSNSNSDSKSNSNIDSNAIRTPGTYLYPHHHGESIMHVDAQPTRPKQQRRPSSRKAVPGAPATMAAPNVVVSDAASGAPSATSGALDGIQHAIPQIQERLKLAKLDHMKWHTILNNHASTRPKALGGKLCESVTACKQFDRVGTMHRCRPTTKRNVTNITTTAAA